MPAITPATPSTAAELAASIAADTAELAALRRELELRRLLAITP